MSLWTCWGPAWREQGHVSVLGEEHEINKGMGQRYRLLRFSCKGDIHHTSTNKKCKLCLQRTVSWTAETLKRKQGHRGQTTSVLNA